MKTVEVSESALESLKAMVDKLQSERDELLSMAKKCVSAVNWRASVYCAGESDKFAFADDAMWESIENLSSSIAKCTQTQSICDWQEKMNG